MGGQSALRVAGFVPDAAYNAACAKLAAVVVSRAQYMPPSGGDDTAVQQAVRHKSHRYSVPWQGGGDNGKLSFMEAAQELPHPSNDHHLSLPADLLELIEWVVRRRESTAEALRKRTRLLADVEVSLRPLNARMLATCKPHVYHVVRQYNLAFMACMIDATSFPDVARLGAALHPRLSHVWDAATMWFFLKRRSTSSQASGRRTHGCVQHRLESQAV